MSVKIKYKGHASYLDTTTNVCMSPRDIRTNRHYSFRYKSYNSPQLSLSHTVSVSQCTQVFLTTLTFLSVQFSRVEYVYIVGQWRSLTFKAKGLADPESKAYTETSRTVFLNTGYTLEASGVLLKMQSFLLQIN